MTSIDNDLEKLLAGDVVPVHTVDMEPYTNQAKHKDFRPVVRRSVCYIVMAFIFDNDGRVVLIQEAKASCKGLWYLPAGRVDPGENLVDAAKREVLEESGLMFEPIAFSALEIYGDPKWMRVVYIGKAVGGQLKTIEQKDEESLQAQWFTVQQVLSEAVPLRHKDFFRSLRLAQQYMSSSPEGRHPAYQIGIQPHHQILHRPVITRLGTNGGAEVLCYKTGPRLICCRLGPPENGLMGVMESAYNIVRSAFNAPPELILTIRGLLTLEHCGIPTQEHDGICLTTVVTIPETWYKKLDTFANTDYTWHTIADPRVQAEFNRRISTDTLLIPFITGF